MPAPLAYIVGASHSGSTLLAMLLGAHPEACTTGELKTGNIADPEQYRCSCGALLKACSFWAQVNQAMAKRGIPNFEISRAGTSIFDVQSRFANRLLAPLYRGPLMEWVRDTALLTSGAWRAHLRETQRRNAALVESLLEVRGAKIVVDSSKIALRLKYLLRNPGLEVKVLRLVRDGRAVSLTYTDEWTFADASDPALRGGGSGVRRAPPRRNMAEAAREWKRSNEAADCLVARLPRSQWLEVRYEALCAEPEPTLRRVCDFLRLDPNKINLKFRALPQHVIGNGMRLDSSSEIRLDERWRNALNPAALEAFNAVAGPLNQLYGYC